MTTNNRICALFGIERPIIQGGMVWCSGWRLASAVSNCGGLGLLGAGSMHPETLVEHIQKMKQATQKPWGVNVPLMYPEIERLMDILISEGVKIVFTSAGSPKKYTQRLHDAGIKVAHVVSSSLFARKCEEAGVDAIVAEGFEAGGHNGREETTTMALIPSVRKATTLPLIAAGGIGSGQAILAAEALGAEGVQIGTLFALAMLCLKKLSPTRLVKNTLYERIAEAEAMGAEAEELRALLGQAASKRGIFLGETADGEVEIGQVASAITSIDSVSTIMSRLLQEYEETKRRLLG